MTTKTSLAANVNQAIEKLFQSKGWQYDTTEQGYFLDFVWEYEGEEHLYTLFLSATDRLLHARGLFEETEAELPLDLPKLMDRFRGEEALYYGGLGFSGGKVNYWLNQLIPSGLDDGAMLALVTETVDAATMDIRRFLQEVHLKRREDERQQMETPRPTFNM